jgi:hypothetical protein
MSSSRSLRVIDGSLLGFRSHPSLMEAVRSRETVAVCLLISYRVSRSVPPDTQFWSLALLTIDVLVIHGLAACGGKPYLTR